MKNYRVLLFSILFLVGALSSCTKDDDSPEGKVVAGIYVVNYGSYSGVKTEISTYNEDTKVISNDVYESINGNGLGSNVQSMGIHQGKAYMMSNNGDKIDIVDSETLLASVNPIKEGVTKPRYFTAKGNYGYVSCWGNVDDWSVMANSYIAKIDLTTNKVVKQIPVAGGIEGVQIVGNKLYGAVYTTNRVMVMDLDEEKVEYIGVNAIPQHLVQDADGNLWVSVVSTYSVPFDAAKVGVTRINTTNDQVDAFVNFQGISSNGYLQISKDKKTIFVMGAEPYPSTKSNVYTVDIEDKKLSTEPLVEGESYYGLGYNPVSEKLYVLISPGTTERGTVQVYSEDGSLEDTQKVGVAPQHVVFNLK